MRRVVSKMIQCPKKFSRRPIVGLHNFRDTSFTQSFIQEIAVSCARANPSSDLIEQNPDLVSSTVLIVLLESRHHRGSTKRPHNAIPDPPRMHLDALPIHSPPHFPQRHSCPYNITFPFSGTRSTFGEAISCRMTRITDCSSSPLGMVRGTVTSAPRGDLRQLCRRGTAQSVEIRRSLSHLPHRLSPVRISIVSVRFQA